MCIDLTLPLYQIYMPCIEEFIEEVAPAKYISTLDLTKRYMSLAEKADNFCHPYGEI